MHTHTYMRSALNFGVSLLISITLEKILALYVSTCGLNAEDNGLKLVLGLQMQGCKQIVYIKLTLVV